MTSLDFCLSPYQEGYYDLTVNNGLIDETSTFLTAILMTIYCDQRASETEVISPERRRGWWGDLLNTNNHQLGSKFWFLQQARNTDYTLNFITNHIKQRLTDAFVLDGYVENIVVTGNKRDTVLSLQIKFIIKENVEVEIFNAWIDLVNETCLLGKNGETLNLLVGYSNGERFTFINENNINISTTKKRPVASDFERLLLVAGETNYLVLTGSTNILNY